MKMQKYPWRRIAATAGAMLLVLLVAASYRFVMARGFFAAAPDKTPGHCRTVGGIGEVAGIATGPLGVFVAARQGGLYLYANGGLTRFAGTPSDFHLVALGVVGPRLQAVFARRDGSYAIAMFNIQPGTLTEVGRLSTDMLTDPVAIAAVDGERFYLVNKHGSHTAFGRWLDDTFLLPRADVLYFDGMKFVKVAERLNSPAGLALSPDLSHLYVGQGLPRSIASFDRNVFMGSLDHAALFDIGAGPRQITVANDGSLIVAAWPKHGTGAVYRVKVEGGVPAAAELLYAASSQEVTAAVETNGHLLIGSGSRLVDCRL